jgi:hypothetical protein
MKLSGVGGSVDKIHLTYDGRKWAIVDKTLSTWVERGSGRLSLIYEGPSWTVVDYFLSTMACLSRRKLNNL